MNCIVYATLNTSGNLYHLNAPNSYIEQSITSLNLESISMHTNDREVKIQS